MNSNYNIEYESASVSESNSSVSSDYDSEDYEQEFEYMEKAFPGASFEICMRVKELDKVISDENTIVVKSSYGCYCYDECKRNDETYIIQGEKITNRYVIEQLILQGLTIDCNHRFLELIQKVPDSVCEFKLWFGS